MASGHLVSDRDFAHDCDRDLDGADHAGGELVALVAGKLTDVHNFSVFAVGQGQRSVFDIAGFFAKDDAQEFFFSSEISLAFWGDLADQDVAGFHVRADADHTRFIEVFEFFFAYVRDVARHDFRTELGVADVNLEIFDVNRAVAILFQHAGGDNDRVLIVVTAPGQKSHEHILAEREFALFSARAVREGLAAQNFLAALHDRFLVDACRGVGA